MSEYYFEPNWLKLLIFLTIVFVLLYLFHVLMRRWLKVEEKKLFSYNHVNDNQPYEKLNNKYSLLMN